MKIKLKNQKNLRLVPKDTCIYMNEEILTIRFALDKSQLMEPLISTDHPLITYDGPQSLSCLTCNLCDSNLLKEGPLKIKGAPSENWREVVELWQCHNESFDNYINADTREIQVPPDLTLAYFNTLILARNAHIANVNI